jgi:hypothetical protein
VDRRRFLLAGLSLGGMASSGVSVGAHAAGRSAGGTDTVVVRESGLPAWPLFEWAQPGGVFGSGKAVMQAPPLAVYGDGIAYADAAVRLALPAVWVETLCAQALGVLNTPGELVRDGNRPLPAGGPCDVIRARTSAGDYLAARIGDWGDGDPGHAYPARLRELYQQVQAFRREVRHRGRPWRPREVLLGVAAVGGRPHRCRDWPRRLPAPGEQRYQEIRLPGGPGGLPRATSGVWPVYRVGGNRFVAATWRHLLPHEITKG